MELTGSGSGKFVNLKNSYEVNVCKKLVKHTNREIKKTNFKKRSLPQKQNVRGLVLIRVLPSIVAVEWRG
jgi:hypothetical protein